MTELLERSLSEIATALRNGELAAEALADAAIDRRERIGEPLAAYKTWDADKFRAHARAADAAAKAGRPAGPLHGVPVSAKDIFGVKGYPTFAGSPRQLPAAWELEGPIIQGLRSQMAVISGKTHSVQFAFGGLGTNPHWGTPRNPWDPKDHRTPGGSSSGAGVSLAEGSALLALGSDTGGSVRIPASKTGNVGLKTSTGRWSVKGIVPLSPTLDTAGVLARSVADIVYAFGAMDPAHGNPDHLSTVLSGYSVSDFRFGICDNFMWEDCSPGVAEAIQVTLDELTGRGARIERIEFPELREGFDLHLKGSIVSAECADFLNRELPEWIDEIDPSVRKRIADGGEIPALEFLSRRQRIEELGDIALDRLKGLDALLAPTLSITPPTMADVSDPEDHVRLNRFCFRNTCPANMLSLCALSLPAGLDAKGMPVGLQIIARHGDEERLLSIAIAIEDVLGPPRARIGSAPMCRP